MIYGRVDVDDVFGRGMVRGGASRVTPRVHPFRRPPHPNRGSSSSSSASSGGGWGYPVAVSDGGSAGGGVDIEGIADQVVADLMRASAPSGPVSFGAEEEEPEFGAVVPTSALPNSAQNRLAQTRYVERMRRDVRDRSAYLQAMENPPEEITTIFDPNPTVIEREVVSVAEEPRYGSRYGFSCSVPQGKDRMGGLDVQTDVTRPSRVPPEFFGGVPAPMVPSHTGFGGLPAPMVPRHAYGVLPPPMVPSHYGEDFAPLKPSPFMDALKIGLGVGLGVTAVVVGVNLVGRAMR